jgi:type II secretory pathway pseudopilin PulG
VILAVLAAIAIPALTGYIDKANERALITDGRNVQVALQEILSEYYGDHNEALVLDATAGKGDTGATTVNDAEIATTISKLVGKTYIANNLTKIKTNDNKVEQFAVKMGDKWVGFVEGKTPKYKVAANETAALTRT